MSMKSLEFLSERGPCGLVTLLVLENFLTSQDCVAGGVRSVLTLDEDRDRKHT